MTFQFRPAKREQISLLLGLAGGTGSGKTYSALELASGIAEFTGKPFALIDTEARRGLHYADRFTFDHGDLGPPFTPLRYTEAIMAADAAGYSAIVVDSASHLWSGDGGVLDMQEHEFARMNSREQAKMASWIKPKGEHKKFVTKLLQLRAHLILCFRAEEKVEMRKVNGKMEVLPKQTLTGLDGWVPICEKNLPFELTTSFLLRASNPGVPLPIKLEAQHRAIFPEGEKIDRDAGRRLAEWAAGGEARQVDTPNSKITATLAAFQAIGVSAPKLEESIGHPLTEDDLPALRKLYADHMRRAQQAVKAPPKPPEPEGTADEPTPETGF
jgi:hypothetical protein